MISSSNFLGKMQADGRARTLAFGAAVAVVLLFGLLSAGPAYAATTFTVDTTADLPDANPGDGACVVSIFGGCTLRAAIEEANATRGADTIKFNISGSGSHTISPASALPQITQTLTIDGYTQPGASRNTNPDPVQGSDAAPKIELDGTGAGDFVSGLLIKATAPNSVVKGLVINRFDGNGILVEPGGKGNRIEGNFIGTDPGGAEDRGNGASGVAIGGLTGGNNTVGGTLPAARNVISGNDRQSVDVGSSGNRVEGNIIGARKDGISALGNSLSGVNIGHFGNTVGGADTRAANVIAFSGKDGVKIAGNLSTGNRILSNSIFSNGLLGIDLGGDGRTPNDPKDPDKGPNALQNFPVLASATTSSATTTITGTLNSTPSTKHKKRSFTIQFFSNPSGTDEGKKFIGQKKVTTNRQGDATFTFVPSQEVPVGEAITATATSGSGNTSELSDPREVV